MILSLEKGSTTPDRLTTDNEKTSTVEKRLPQFGHWRRLRIDEPSSAVRESTTRESECLQNGQYMPLLSHVMVPKLVCAALPTISW